MNIDIEFNKETSYSYFNSKELSWKEVLKIIKEWMKEDYE